MPSPPPLEFNGRRKKKVLKSYFFLDGMTFNPPVMACIKKRFFLQLPNYIGGMRIISALTRRNMRRLQSCIEQGLSILGSVCAGVKHLRFKIFPFM